MIVESGWVIVHMKSVRSRYTPSSGWQFQCEFATMQSFEPLQCPPAATSYCTWEAIPWVVGAELAMDQCDGNALQNSWHSRQRQDTVLVQTGTNQSAGTVDIVAYYMGTYRRRRAEAYSPIGESDKCLSWYSCK